MSPLARIAVPAGTELEISGVTVSLEQDAVVLTSRENVERLQKEDSTVRMLPQVHPKPRARC